MKNEHHLIPYLADLDIQIDYEQHRIYFNTAEMQVRGMTSGAFVWLPVLVDSKSRDVIIDIDDLTIVTTTSRIVALHLFNADFEYKFDPTYDRFSTYDPKQRPYGRVQFVGHGNLPGGMPRKLYWDEMRRHGDQVVSAQSDDPPYNEDGTFPGVRFRTSHATLTDYVRVVSKYWRSAWGSSDVDLVREQLTAAVLARDPDSTLRPCDEGPLFADDNVREEVNNILDELGIPEAQEEPEWMDAEPAFVVKDVIDDLDLRVGAVVAFRGQPDIRFTVGPSKSVYRVREDGVLVCLVIPNYDMLMNPEPEASIDAKLAAMQELMDIKIDALQTELGQVLSDLNELIIGREVLNADAEVHECDAG